MWFLWIFILIYVTVSIFWFYWNDLVLRWNSTYVLAATGSFTGVLLLYLLKNNDYYYMTATGWQTTLHNYDSFVLKLFTVFPFLWKIDKQKLYKDFEKPSADESQLFFSQQREFILKFMQNAFSEITTNHHILLDYVFGSREMRKSQKSLIRRRIFDMECFILNLKKVDDLRVIKSKESEDLEQTFAGIRHSLNELISKHNAQIPPVIYHTAIGGSIVTTCLTVPMFFIHYDFIWGSISSFATFGFFSYLLHSSLYLGSIFNSHCYHHEKYAREVKHFTEQLESNLIIRLSSNFTSQLQILSKFTCKSDDSEIKSVMAREKKDLKSFRGGSTVEKRKKEHV